MQKFDRILDGNNVIGALRIDAVDHRGQRGGLTGTGGSRNQHQPALLFANLGNDRRKIQLLHRTNLGGNHAQHHSNVAALLKHVHTEAAQARDAVCHIQFRSFLELLFLPVGHHAERHGKHLFRRNARHIGQRGEQAVDAQIGVIADFQVQVGRFVFNGATEKIVDA